MGASRRRGRLATGPRNDNHDLPESSRSEKWLLHVRVSLCRRFATLSRSDSPMGRSTVETRMSRWLRLHPPRTDGAREIDVRRPSVRIPDRCDGISFARGYSGCRRQIASGSHLGAIWEPDGKWAAAAEGGQMRGKALVVRG